MSDKLGFGCMRFPATGFGERNVDLEQVKKMFDVFMQAGYNYYDTAYMYHSGNSERIVKAALVDRYPRESFTITDKLPMMMLTNPKQMEVVFEEQLQKVGVEYFDYYWLHALNTGEYNKVQKWDAFGFINQKKAEGKIKHIGFSFHDTAEVLEKILIEHPEVEFVQLQINYLDWEDPNVQSRKCYEVATKYNKKVIVMEPVKGGKLAELPQSCIDILNKIDEKATPATWALRFVASLPNVYKVLSGMSNLEQVVDNTTNMINFKQLDERSLNLLATVAKILKGRKQIPCTACRYCQDGCQKKVAIPEYFRLYNKKEDFDKEELIKKYNEIVLSGRGKASECIKCGACERVCPQHIQIRNNLDEIVKFFEK